ncbi:MAG: DUF4405 domain-containing protein [Alphaproteobacteria bacterium]
MIKKIFHRKWTSPLIIAICLLPLITGVFMFFGYFKGTPMKIIHEWLGLLMVLAVVAHLITHWASLKMYIKEKRVWVMSAIFVILVPFYFVAIAPKFQQEQSQKFSPRYVIDVLSQANLDNFALLANLDAETLKAKLTKQGIQLQNPSETILTIAKNNEKSSMDIFKILSE